MFKFIQKVVDSILKEDMDRADKLIAEMRIHTTEMACRQVSMDREFVEIFERERLEHKQVRRQIEGLGFCFDANGKASFLEVSK